MNKFRKEKYIYQNQSKLTGKWSFRVKYLDIDESFHEEKYLSASMAFKEAVNFRNKIVSNPKLDAFKKSCLTVQETYELINNYYSLSSETHRKLNGAYSNYVSCKDKNLNKVTIEDIQKDLNNMAYDCSSDLIYRVRSIWIKIFKVGIIKGLVSTNYAELTEVPKSRKIKPNKRNEQTDEQTLDTLSKYLSTHLKSSHERFYAQHILKVLFLTGMRPSEMFCLTKQDIDLKKKTIRINKRINSSRELQSIENTKTDESNRVIPFTEKLYETFKELLKTNDDNVLLFPNEEGGYYLPATLSDRYHKIAKNIGIDFHMYQCRHTFITNLYQSGVDIKTIQDLVGQKIDATTLGYVISSEERMKNAIKFI